MTLIGLYEGRELEKADINEKVIQVISDQSKSDSGPCAPKYVKEPLRDMVQRVAVKLIEINKDEIKLLSQNQKIICRINDGTWIPVKEFLEKLKLIEDADLKSIENIKK